MPGSSNADLDGLIAARDHRSVLKLRLLAFTASCVDRMVYAFEGEDDKVAFSRWIARIDARKRYEAFVCGGKSSACTISNIIHDDAGDIASRIVIFVDRDFDDLEGFSPVDWIYCTDRYSIENYIVDREVLEEILLEDFPLDGEAEKRSRILEHFSRHYQTFLEHTRLANFRLFVARKERIRRGEPFNPRLSNLVRFSIYEILPLDEQRWDSMPLIREPTGEEYENWRESFDSLIPSERFRGKFAYLFFKAFLRELCDACRNGCTILFEGQARTNIREGEMSLGSMATKSPIPMGLDDFITKLPP